MYLLSGPTLLPKLGKLTQNLDRAFNLLLDPLIKLPAEPTNVNLLLDHHFGDDPNDPREELSLRFLAARFLGL